MDNNTALILFAVIVAAFLLLNDAIEAWKAKHAPSAEPAAEQFTELDFEPGEAVIVHFPLSADHDDRARHLAALKSAFPRTTFMSGVAGATYTVVEAGQGLHP